MSSGGGGGGASGARGGSDEPSVLQAFGAHRIARRARGPASQATGACLEDRATAGPSALWVRNYPRAPARWDRPESPETKPIANRSQVRQGGAGSARSGRSSREDRDGLENRHTFCGPDGTARSHADHGPHVAPLRRVATRLGVGLPDAAAGDVGVPPAVRAVPTVRRRGGLVLVAGGIGAHEPLAERRGAALGARRRARSTRRRTMSPSRC